MRRRRRAALWGAAAAALATTVLVAGCDIGGDDGEPQGRNGDGATANAVSTAARRTAEAGTARLAYEALIATQGNEQGLRAEGEVDFAANRGHLVYDASESPIAGAREVEVALDGNVAYVRFPDGSPEFQLPTGKSWIRVPPPAPGGPETEDPETRTIRPALTTMRQDPNQFLRWLPSGATEVQREDTEEVRGVETTIYSALLDLDRVLEDGGDELGADEDQREAARRTVQELKDQLAGQVLSVTVNVGPDGLIRRLLVSFDVQTSGALVSTLTTTDYYDFGAEVDVEPPPAGQVVEAAEVS